MAQHATTLDEVLTLRSENARLEAALKVTRDALATVGIYDVKNLGSLEQSGRPRRYFECRLCGDWNDEARHIEHADGCPLRI